MECIIAMKPRILRKLLIIGSKVIKKRFAFALMSAIILTSCAEDDQGSSFTGGEPELLSNILDNPEDFIFFGSFESTKPGDPEWIQDWGIAYTARIDQIELINNAVHGERAIRIPFPKGNYGAVNTGVQFPIQFSRINTIPKTFDSLYLSYHVYFEDGFDFRLGGKLPGLMGGGTSWERTGGSLPTGSNGWSMRFMWRERGRAVIYAYLPPGKYRMTPTWGSDIELGASFTTGQWHHVEQYIKVNSINKENGQLRVWLDGKKLLDLNDIGYRSVENDKGAIGGILVSLFHGGDDSRWAPTRNSYIRLDNIIASRKRISTFLKDKKIDSKL